MIRVKGKALIQVDYDVTLNMTAEQFLMLALENKAEAVKAAITWNTIEGDAEVVSVEQGYLVKKEERK